MQDPEVPDGMVFEGWNVEIPEFIPAHDVDILGTYKAVSRVSCISLEEYIVVSVYDFKGTMLYYEKRWGEIADIIPEGLYIINGVIRMIKHQ